MHVLTCDLHECRFTWALLAPTPSGSCGLQAPAGYVGSLPLGFQGAATCIAHNLELQMPHDAYSTVNAD